MIVSNVAFMWFYTAMILALVIAAGARDAIVLVRLMREKDYTPAVKDRVFGSVMGLLLCAVGFGGVIKFHWF